MNKEMHCLSLSLVFDKIVSKECSRTFLPMRLKPNRETFINSVRKDLMWYFYVRDVVNRAVDENIQRVKFLYEELQTVTAPEISSEQQFDSEIGRTDFACETQTEELQVGWAREAVSKDWMLIVNTELFPQMVRIEKCM